MRPLFLETSAVLAALLGEPDGRKAKARMAASRRLVASRLLLVEAQRALVRLLLDAPERQTDVADLRRNLGVLTAKLNVIEISRSICDSAGRVAPHVRLRSLDAIHVATFLRIRETEPEIEMVSFDRRVLEAVSQGV